MYIHLKIIGTLLIFLALLHVIFPKYFKWATELSNLSLVNRQIMQVHTFFIALTVLLMGLLCLTSSHELLSTPLGKKIGIGLAVFWFIRLLFQLWVYSPRLWKGKTWETAVHILLTCGWIYLSFIFSMIAWG